VPEWYDVLFYCSVVFVLGFNSWFVTAFIWFLIGASDLERRHEAKKLLGQVAINNKGEIFEYSKDN
jgi:hypothetical protein